MMKCELCERDFEAGELVLPAGLFSENFDTVTPVWHHGVHLACLQEILECVRGLTPQLLPHRVVVAPSTTPQEEAQDNG